MFHGCIANICERTWYDPCRTLPRQAHQSIKNLILTPDNEPYLGLQELLTLDHVIIATMNEMSRAKKYTYLQDISSYQKAAILIIPSGVSLTLSVRELIRQGYLHGALTLIWPIIERTITIKYLRKHPEALDEWEQGWKYSKRPKLKDMISALYSDLIDGETAALMSENGWSLHTALTSEGNDIVHGGSSSLQLNINLSSEGFVTTPGRVIDRPDLARKASLECSSWLCLLLAEICVAFPENR